MRTALCDLLGISVPIIQAPMGVAVGPDLVAAVCNAGGLGTIPLWRANTSTMREQIRQIRTLTDKPFAVNLNLAFPTREKLEICLEEKVPIISFFWGDPMSLISRAKEGGAIVLQTVSSAHEATVAVQQGVDVVVAQGWEAGGHVRGTVGTMALVPAVVDAISPVPVVAAGGVADGRGMAAALALGATGVWIGTRFLASKEVNIHAHYRKRLLNASESDTVHLANLFDIGWPDAAHRVLRNYVVSEWEAAGRPISGGRPGEGETIGNTPSFGPILRYQCRTPDTDFVGDTEAMSMWAGQGVGLVRHVQPAAEIVHEINDEAEAILASLGKALV